MRANILKAQRQLQNKTQKDCAKALDLTLNTYNKKENGLTPFNTDEIVLLCDYLKITSDSLKCSIFL